MVERVGIAIGPDLLQAFDGLCHDKGYANRSEAVRDLIRDAIVQRQWTAGAEGTTDQVAVVTLVYDHDASDLAQKLTHLQHEHLGLVVSSIHVHLDEHNCLEVLILRGDPVEVLRMGDALCATRGVKHGKVVPATTGRGL